MPELPDVEAFRRFFRLHASGRKVASISADPTIVRNTTPRTLDRALRGRTFEDPDRHGKWLICRTDGPVLLVHFGMTGDLIWSEDEPQRHRHDRLIIRFDDGRELRYRNMRKLGGVWLAHDAAEEKEVMGLLGPDALTIRRKPFLDLLARRRGGVKAALMDQTFVAGIGNIIADEVLWHARIHPRRTIDSLNDEERARLFADVHKIIREAVDGYDYIHRKRSWLSRVRGLPGATCPRCGTPLGRTTAAGRTTYFCPHCQGPDPVPWPRDRDAEMGVDRRALRGSAGSARRRNHHPQRRAAVLHVGASPGRPLRPGQT
jgi:formamidopyrimidine-DNA glycosylase